MSRGAKQQKALLPSLDTGPVPLHGIRDAARRQLIDLIDSKRGKKALILEPSISGPLTLLDAGLSELLTEHGVVKLLYLERKRLDDAAYNQGDPRLADVKSIIYVVRATLENAQLIAWQIKNSKGLQGTEFSAFWVPRRAIAVERLLEEEGVYGDLTMGEFALDMVALDDDVLSLELDTAFRECTLEGDSTALFYAAAAIMRLQHMWGLVSRIQGKGPAAAAVKDMCIKMRKERPLPLQATGSSKVDRIILLDREVDVVTPMVTQITFEGLIDEITGIKHGAVTWTPRERRPGDASSSADAAAAGSRPGRGGTSLLNSSDPFYREFRDLPWHITSQRLQQYARDARKEYTELSQKDLTQLKSFVKGLPKLMMLDRLSDIASPVAEQVKNQSFHDRLKVEQDIIDGYDTDEAATFIMELMWRGGELMSVLRLMVLLSTCCSGIPKKHYDTLRSELLATYGHQHLLTLINLEKAGLLRQAGGRASFAPMRKALRLLVPEDDALSADPTDVSFIYKGYAPISIRLVEQALKGGWAPVVEALSLLPGAQFDSVQLQEPDGKVVDKPFKAAAGGSVHSATSASTTTASAGAQQQQQQPSTASGEPETVLVVFLGGCTFSEISALRWLGSRPDSRARFIVLTTKIINGNNLLDSFVDPVARRGFAAGGAGSSQAASVH